MVPVENQMTDEELESKSAVQYVLRCRKGFASRLSVRISRYYNSVTKVLICKLVLDKFAN